jgi:putative selenate reductase FAD-binding subunit
MVSEILRPRTIAEAIKLTAMPGTAVLGGGTWLNAGFAVAGAMTTGAGPAPAGPATPGAGTRPAGAPIALISLDSLGLDFVEWRNGTLRIGAAATFQQVLDAPGVPDALRKALAATASRTLRNMITVGGELGHCPADSVLIPTLAALDARIRIAGRRPFGIAEYRAARALGPVGLILEVSAPDADGPCAVQALSRTSHGRRSLVIVVAAARLLPNVSRVSIVASDCRGQVLRLADAEEALEGSPLPPKDRIEKLVRAAFWPTSDLHASTEYKRYLAGVYAADLLHALMGRQASP